MLRYTIIGCDPGSSSGAFSWIIATNGGTISYDSIRFSKSSEREVADKLEELRNMHKKMGGKIFCLVEKAGSMPGEGHMGALTFGENIGFIRGILMSLRIPFDYISPQKWQKEFVPPVQGRITLNKKVKSDNNWGGLDLGRQKELEKEFKKHNTGLKNDQKKRLKEKAEILFPNVRILNDNADAFLICKYAEKHYSGNPTAGMDSTSGNTTDDLPF